MLHFYNTLSRRLEPFEPLVPGRVGMYACGPTIYAPPHIGNMRTFFFADVLHRYLEFRDFDVTFVMNLTDVDDKTIRGAIREGTSLHQYTGPYADLLFESLDRLGIVGADHYPRATDHVDGMIDLIRRLEERGLAYETEGSVYFDISEFPEYGKLSRVDLSQGRRGERVASDEYDKADVRDFALWKAAKPEDEQVGAVWDSPWGPGRPGWHIECSVMSMRLLGETFDIHCGGVDLVFPHHEDEIAQSEGATGKPFARYLLHGDFLQWEGAKMAKSTGNLFTLQDLLERGVRASSIRHTFLTAHYRSKLNFTWEALAASAEAVRRLVQTRDRLADHPGVPDGDSRGPLGEAADRALTAFTAGMDDDLNTSLALAALFGLVREINARLDRLDLDPIPETERAAALDALQQMDGVLGLLTTADREGGLDEELQQWAEERVAQREAARKARDFARADALREELASRGIVVEDTPAGPRWSQRG